MGPGGQNGTRRKHRSVGLYLGHGDQILFPTEEAGVSSPPHPRRNQRRMIPIPPLAGPRGLEALGPYDAPFFKELNLNVAKNISKDPPHPTPLPVGERGRGEGKRSPQVMFSNRGEEQFAPHETMAVEHFAEIFFAPGGKMQRNNVRGLSVFLILPSKAGAPFPRQRPRIRHSGL